MKRLIRVESIALLMLAALVFISSAWAETRTGQGQKDMSPVQKNQGNPDQNPEITAGTLSDNDLAGQVRIDEQLGSVAALDAVFRDETGREIRLDALFDKPVVLLPVSFSCTAVCSYLQAALVKALNEVDQEPGKDFNIITLSFDEAENETDAAAARQNYANLVKREFPPEKWSYLTGDRENILKLTGSLGYYFIKKAEHLYDHPSALVVLARDGKIIRYLHGPNFPAFDLGMAIGEAEAGTSSMKGRVLSFCYAYDPVRKTYTFKLFKVFGTLALIGLAGFVIFLLFPLKRKNEDAPGA